MHLVVISSVLVATGGLMAWRSNRNWLSPIVVTVSVFLLYYSGGLIFFFAQGHALIPFYVALGIFFYCLGAMLVAGLKDFRPLIERWSFSEAPFVSIFPIRKVFFASLWIASGFSVGLGAVYFYQVGIPLFSEWSSFVRTEAIAGRGIYLRSLFTFLPVATVLAFLYNKYHKTRSSTILMSLLLVFCCLYLILFGSRGAAINYLVPFLFVMGVLYNRKITKKALSLIMFFLLAALTIQYTYLGYRSLPLSQSVDVLFKRLTFQQVEALDYLVYDVIPLRGFYLGYVHGIGLKSISSLFRIIPYEPPFGEILFSMKAGGQPATRFTLVTTTFGDLYADFGAFGICAGMLLYGMITQFLYIRLLRGKKDYFKLAALCYLHFVILSAHIGGDVFGILVNKGVSLAVFVLLVSTLYAMISLPTGQISILLPRRQKLV